MTQALVQLEKQYPITVESVGELLETLEVNLGGEKISPFDLDRIKVPGAGSVSWQVHGMGEPEEVREIRGVIIHQKLVRAYWEKDFDEGGGKEPPDCYSDDSLMGYGHPGGVCESCPKAQFGTAAKGDGQACKQHRLLFLLRPEEILPSVISVPPSGLKNLKRYILGLSKRRLPLHGVVTLLTLSRDKSAGGKPFARVNVTLGDRLPPELARAMKVYGDEIRPQLDQVRLDDEVRLGKEALDLSQ